MTRSLKGREAGRSKRQLRDRLAVLSWAILYVSNIKFQMGLKKRRKKAAASEAAAAEDAIPLLALLEAKKRVAKLGSAEVAKRAILALAELGD